MTMDNWLARHHVQCGTYIKHNSADIFSVFVRFCYTVAALLRFQGGGDSRKFLQKYSILTKCWVVKPCSPVWNTTHPLRSLSPPSARVHTKTRASSWSSGTYQPMSDSHELLNIILRNRNAKRTIQNVIKLHLKYMQKYSIKDVIVDWPLITSLPYQNTSTCSFDIIRIIHKNLRGAKVLSVLLWVCPSHHFCQEHTV